MKGRTISVSLEARIDPALVPQRTLRSGRAIPAIGMGTFGSDKYGAADVGGAVRDALAAGYRLIDCAAVYGNEAALIQQGELFQFCVDHGVQPVGYSPLHSPSRPTRDTTSKDVSDIDLPVVRGIAEARGIHPALVCLKWAGYRSPAL